MRSTMPALTEMEKRFAVLCVVLMGLALIVLAFSGCAKHPGSSIIERTAAGGQVSVEIPAERTFDRKNLPAGVEAKEVVNVIPVTIEIPAESAPTESRIAPGPGEPIPNQAEAAKKPRSKPKTVSGNLYVLKDGNVVADKPLDEVIGRPQTIKRSWAWLYWAVGAILALVAVAWVVDKFVKPISFIARWFRR